MNYDSAVLVMYRWLMLLLTALALAVGSILTVLSMNWWPVTAVTGTHFGQKSVIALRTCSEIAEDTRRSLLDSGASDARAVEKSDRAYNICITGRGKESDGIESTND